MKFEASAPVYLSLAIALPCAFSFTQADVQTEQRPPAAVQKSAGHQSEAPGGEPSRRLSFGRNIETPAGSRQTIRSEASLNDYSAYRAGDYYYVTLPQASANGDVRLRGGRAYTEMRVQRRGADVLISYLLRPGFSARVEQRFGRLDVVFEENGGGTNATRQREGAEVSGEAGARHSPATTPPTVANRNDSSSPPGQLRAVETADKPEATLNGPQSKGESTQPPSMSPTPPPTTPLTNVSGDSQPAAATTWKALLQKREFAVLAALLVVACIGLLIASRRLKSRKRQTVGDGPARPATSPAEEEKLVSAEAGGSTEAESIALAAAFDQTSTSAGQSEIHPPTPLDGADGSAPLFGEPPAHGQLQNHFSPPDATEDDADAAVAEPPSVGDDATFESICAAFDDEGVETRSAAARALYGFGQSPIESFGRALREATPGRRREIGAAISSSGLAAESLSQLAGGGREQTYEAFSLLFLMAKAGEVQPLLRAIEGHPSHEVRLAVVKLLALSGQKEILPAFRRLKTRSSLPAEVRDAIADAIELLNSQTQT